jgi:NADH:ubiquinone oxidoreductase subunit 5 (subunit L)/multisubunit Na+/H+ antiporter MnhA subunit
MISAALPLTLLGCLPAASLLFTRIAGVDGLQTLKTVLAATATTAGCLFLMVLLLSGSGATIDPVTVALTSLTLFVGWIVLGFASRHMVADARLSTFATRVGLMLSSVLVLVSTDSLWLFALAWIASGWLLAEVIGHAPDWPEAKAAKRRARRAFLVSDLSMVAGLGLIAGLGGAWTFDALPAAVAGLDWSIKLAGGSLLLVAALARCAAPPFHKWLMGSMTAPTPVSALMHAGLVNAGGLLLIRVAPLLEALPAIKAAMIVAGAAGALFGTGVMIVRPDIKRALGGSTVAQMSFMVMTCGFGAYGAALWHLVAHGLFKSWLFLSAGSAVGRAPKPRLAPWTSAESIQSIGLAAAVAIATLGVTAAAGLPLPTMLALVAAFTAAITALRWEGKARPILLAPAGLLILCYAGGAFLVGRLAGLPVGEPPIGAAAQLTLLGTFLAAWMWQAGRLPLPAPLYVRLLNTGGPALIR